MTHPTEQLAAFVDGALTTAERSDVDVHLSTCSSCRAEVGAAVAARDALRSMGTPATPDDLATPALAEMRRSAASGGPPAWVRYTPWLAAAAVVGLLAVTLPNIGSSSDDAGVAAQAEDQAAPSASVAPKDLRLEIVDQDFDPTSLEAAAGEFAREGARGQITADDAVEGEASMAPDEQQFALAGKPRSTRALTCLQTAFSGFPGTPVRLVSASFQGQPAYLAYILESPGAGQPTDTVTIWVASSKGCASLALTSAAV